MVGQRGAGRYHRAGGGDLHVRRGVQREGDRALGATEATAWTVGVLGSGRGVGGMAVVLNCCRRAVFGRQLVMVRTLPPARGCGVYGKEEPQPEQGSAESLSRSALHGRKPTRGPT